MLDSQRPRISQPVSGTRSGGVGFLATTTGRNIAIGAGLLAAVGAGFLIWHRARQNTAQNALAGTQQTFLPAGMVAAPPAEAVKPAPVPERKPVVLSMDPRSAKPAGSLPLDLLDTKPSMNEPLGAPPATLEARQTTADGVTPRTDTGQPASVPPTVAPKDSTSPATAALPADLGTGTPTNPAANGDTKRLLDEAGRLVQQNQLVAARKKLNDALLDARFSAADRGQMRAQLTTINDSLFFSPQVATGDTVTDIYTIASGDSLGRITRRQGLPIDWRLLQRINRLPSENSIRVGQKIKVVRLPIHAIVHKADYRMDLYAGAPPANPGSAELGPDGQDRSWIYLRSFRVGLGESDGTPEGTFVVRPSSKLINPRWVNPRTGEVFEADNPKNPIGEHWIGLDGSDDNTRKLVGYGVHGTVDPASVGEQRSMGCVRLAADDIAMVYELLVDRLSTVKIIK